MPLPSHRRFLQTLTAGQAIPLVAVVWLSQEPPDHRYRWKRKVVAPDGGFLVFAHQGRQGLTSSVRR